MRFCRIYHLVCLFFCLVWPIGIKVCMMCPRTIFSLLVAISLGVTKCWVKKGARVDHFWPLRYRFLPFDRENLKNGKSEG